MQREVHSFLASWAADVKAQAVKNAPMVTGYLRSTIYAKVKEWVVDVGADAAYALFVELGTKYMQAQPYLYPAIQQYFPELESVIVQAIQHAKAETGL
jgi:HK97 gp10 family phage protein